MTPIEYIYTHTGEPMLKAILISLAAGGVATSFAEYKLSYNLFDKILDVVKKIRSIF